MTIHAYKYLLLNSRKVITPIHVPYNLNLRYFVLLLQLTHIPPTLASVLTFSPVLTASKHHYMDDSAPKKKEPACQIDTKKIAGKSAIFFVYFLYIF